LPRAWLERRMSSLESAAERRTISPGFT
jgi:hypothetical protein